MIYQRELRDLTVSGMVVGSADAADPSVHPKVVSERLGHASVVITLDTYSHAIPAMQETAAELVASLVFDN